MKTFKDLLSEKPSQPKKGDKMFPYTTAKGNPRDAAKETQKSDREKLADIRKDREKDSVKRRTDAINKQKDAAIAKEKEKAAKKISGLVGEENSHGDAIMKKTFKELVREAWGSSNPRVPFKGEYEVEFQPDSATGRSAFYVDHNGGKKPGKIYVKTAYKGEGDSNVDERKFVNDLKKHLAVARKAGENVKVEVRKSK